MCNNCVSLPDCSAKLMVWSNAARSSSPARANFSNASSTTPVAKALAPGPPGVFHNRVATCCSSTSSASKSRGAKLGAFGDMAASNSELMRDMLRSSAVRACAAAARRLPPPRSEAPAQLASERRAPLQSSQPPLTLNLCALAPRLRVPVQPKVGNDADSESWRPDVPRMSPRKPRSRGGPSMRRVVKKRSPSPSSASSSLSLKRITLLSNMSRRERGPLMSPSAGEAMVPTDVGLAP
mmetsp:Transcript_30572/g.88218  ORF Transcript_30572/g.88218 Transcript_30572/m.88218 type:complete len:238 (+) Transcript_30572:743-1456(+)